MHRAVGAYEAPPPSADDEWDTDPDFVNKNNQENAKAQKLATQQLGGVRTATEAAKIVRNNQVEMDRQRGITSLNGVRAKEDQALIEKKKKEAEEFARKQAAMLQQTEAQIAQSQARAAQVAREQEMLAKQREDNRLKMAADRDQTAARLAAERDAAHKRAEENKKKEEQLFFEKQGKYLAQTDKVIAERDAAKKRQEEEREAQAKAREDNRLKMQADRDREAERLRKEREDALKRGEELKKKDEAAFNSRQANYLSQKDKELAARDEIRNREKQSMEAEAKAREDNRLAREAERAAEVERMRLERGDTSDGGSKAPAVSGGVGNKAAAFTQAANAQKPQAPQVQKTGKVWTPPAASAAPAAAAAAAPAPARAAAAAAPVAQAEPQYDDQPPAPDTDPYAAPADADPYGGAAPSDATYDDTSALDNFGGGAAEPAADAYAGDAYAGDAGAADPYAAGGDAPAAGSVIARALYDYAGEAEGDLKFNEGDTITVTDQSDPGGWWQGECNGAFGAFPSNFVELVQ